MSTPQEAGALRPAARRSWLGLALGIISIALLLWVAGPGLFSSSQCAPDSALLLRNKDHGSAAAAGASSAGSASAALNEEAAQQCPVCPTATACKACAPHPSASSCPSAQACKPCDKAAAAAPAPEPCRNDDAAHPNSTSGLLQTSLYGHALRRLVSFDATKTYIWLNDSYPSGTVVERKEPWPAGQPVKVSMVIRDWPALGHAARDITILWSLLHFQVIKIDDVVFTNVESNKVYGGARLGLIFRDYLLPLTQSIVATAQAGLKEPNVPKIVCHDELPDRYELGRKVQLLDGPLVPYTSPTWFGGMDGGELRYHLYKQHGVSPFPAEPPSRLTFITRKHGRVFRNNDAVEKFLREFAAGRGMEFVALDLGTDKGGALSFRQQVQEFAKTGILVAMHGAACFNAIVMPRNSVVVEVVPTSLRWNLFRTLSHSVGVQHLQFYVDNPLCDGMFNACDAEVNLTERHFRDVMFEAHERMMSFSVGDRLWEKPDAGTRAATHYS